MAKQFTVLAKFIAKDDASAVIKKLTADHDRLQREAVELAAAFARGDKSAKQYTVALGKNSTEQQKLQRAIEKTRTSVEKTNVSVSKSSSVFKGTGASLKGLATSYFGVAAAIGVFVAGVGSAIRRVNEFVRANKSVEASLRSIGVDSKFAAEEVKQWADALSDSARISDTTILSLFTLANGFTRNSEAAQELIEVATNFAEVAAISLEEAVRRLGRSYGGSVEDIANYAGEVRNLTKAQLANGGAIKILKTEYDGFRESTLTELDKAVEDSIKNFDDASRSVETWGAKLVTAGKVVAVDGVILGGIRAMKGALKDFQNNLGGAADAARGLEESLDRLARRQAEAKAQTEQFATASELLLKVLSKAAQKLDQDAYAEFITSSERARDVLRELGVTFEHDVTVRVAELEGALEQVRFEADEGLATWEDYNESVITTGREIGALEAGFTSYAEQQRLSTDLTREHTEATRQERQAVEGLTVSLRTLSAAKQEANQRALEHRREGRGGRIHLPQELGGGSRLLSAFTLEEAQRLVDITGKVNP